MYQTLLITDSEGITKPLHIEYQVSESFFGGLEARINGECKRHLLPHPVVYDLHRKDIQSGFHHLKAIALADLESRGATVIREYEMDITDLRAKVKEFLNSDISAKKTSIYNLFSEAAKSEISYMTFVSVTSKCVLDKYILLVDLELSRIYGETYKKF